MSEPFLSEIRIFSCSFAPKYWALCNGQTLPINQNQALFSLMGTTYGGNGQTTFGLPNLQGRVPIHMGNGHTLGETGGAETVTITSSTMPAHIHPAYADTKVGNNTTSNPSGNYPANTGSTPLYSSGSSNMVTMYPSMVSSTGGSQSHENRQPFTALNYCIALSGIFPSQT